MTENQDEKAITDWVNMLFFVLRWAERNDPDVAQTNNICSITSAQICPCSGPLGKNIIYNTLFSQAPICFSPERST